QIEQLDAYYREAAKISAMPWEKFKTANADLIDSLNKSSAELVKLQMPVLAKAKETEVRTDVKRQMIQAALVRRTGGEKSFNSIVDPSSGKPFEIVNLADGGFSLKSSMDDGKGKPLGLDFSAKAAK